MDHRSSMGAPTQPSLGIRTPSITFRVNTERHHVNHNTKCFDWKKGIAGAVIGRANTASVVGSLD
jgi:hypothetical protein